MLLRKLLLLAPFLITAVYAEPQIELLADGFTFTEGPALNPTDGAVYFTDVPNQRIHRWDAAAGVTVFREDTGGANGLMFDADGNLYMCAGKRREFVQLAPDGAETVLASTYGGGLLNSPNDVWLDPKGGLYFTDPRYGKKDNLEQDGEHVYYLSPDRQTLTRVTDDLVRPNGVIGTPDGKTLLIADHGDSKTWCYTINDDGSLGAKTLFAEQGSDGMSIDAAGNFYLTAAMVDIYSADGEHLESIDVGKRPANVTVISENPVTLFVTAKDSVYLVKLER